MSDDKWGKLVPLSTLRRKWTNLSVYQVPKCEKPFTPPITEAVHRQFRKLTKTKGAFPNENSLMKLLYAGILNARRMDNANPQLEPELSQLAIHFEGRLDGVLDI